MDKVKFQNLKRLQPQLAAMEYDNDFLDHLAGKQKEQPRVPSETLELGWAFLAKFILNELTYDLATNSKSEPNLNLRSLYGEGNVQNPHFFEGENREKFWLINGTDLPVVNGKRLIANPEMLKDPVLIQMAELFMQLHNKYIEIGKDYDEAKELTQWTFQSFVDEFLELVGLAKLQGYIDSSPSMNLSMDFIVCMTAFCLATVKDSFKVNEEEEAEYEGVIAGAIDWSYFFDFNDGHAQWSLEPSIHMAESAYTKGYILQLSKASQDYALPIGEKVALAMGYNAIWQDDENGTPLFHYILKEAFQFPDAPLGMLGAAIINNGILKARSNTFNHYRKNYSMADHNLVFRTFEEIVIFVG